MEMIKVKMTPKMGRGLFAAVSINKGQIIHRAEIIKVLDSEVDKCPALAAYVFMYNKKYSAMALGYGALFNHSKEPNVDYYFTKFENRQVLEFVATRDIAPEEELFIFYGGEDYAFAHKLK